MREFEGGGTRDTEDGKIDPEGCLNPLVIKAFGEYMRRHQETANGLRGSDNWQHLFGEDHLDICLKSAWRHFLDLWLEHRGYKSRDGIEEAIYGLMFNLNAYAYKIELDKLEDK